MTVVSFLIHIFGHRVYRKRNKKLEIPSSSRLPRTILLASLVCRVTVSSSPLCLDPTFSMIDQLTCYLTNNVEAYCAL